MRFANWSIRSSRTRILCWKLSGDVRTMIEVVHSNPPEDHNLVYYRMRVMTLIVKREQNSRYTAHNGLRVRLFPAHKF